MNDFVLRGFCKKCEWPIEWIIDGTLHMLPNEMIREGVSLQHEVEPVWFLSARQIEIVFYSPVFCQWVFGENWKGKGEPSAIWLLRILNEEPFLVAKILKEAGENSKEENK